SQAIFSDPSSATGTTYQLTFAYSTAWANIQGRGFGGFNSYQQYDARTGTYEQFGFAPGFPGTGPVALDRPSCDQPRSQPIRYTSENITSITLDGTTNNQRYFVYPARVTTQEYQVSWSPSSGSSPGALNKTTSTIYAYDTYGNATGVVTTVSDSD